MLLNDGRPNGELFLATGSVQDGNSSDCLEFTVSLVKADKYYMMKSQILESMGYEASVTFPVYADRLPLQLLSFLRLSRVQDPALFAKVRGRGGGVAGAGPCAVCQGEGQGGRGRGCRTLRCLPR